MSSLEEQLILYGGGGGGGAGDGLLFGAEAAEERIKSLLGEGERGGLMRRRVMRRPVGSAALSFGERDADGAALSPLAVADPLSDLLSHISASHAGGESRAHCPRRAAGLALRSARLALQASRGRYSAARGARRPTSPAARRPCRCNICVARRREPRLFTPPAAARCE